MIMLRRFLAVILIMVLIAFICPIEYTYTLSTDLETSKLASCSTVTELQATLSPAPVSGIKGVEPYGTYWYEGKNNLSQYDFSDERDLLYTLTFSNKSQFPEGNKIPNGFDQEELLEWGKYPGLNVDILHKYGFTGVGSIVAYVDQPLEDHSEYSDGNLHYYDLIPNNSNSMHGPAVLSLLIGKNTGTAPDTEVYYLENPAWLANQSTHAECLYKIIDINKTLPDEKKITMVGFSDNVDPSEANHEAFQDAIDTCKAEGIMVWLCGEPLQLMSANFIPLSDRNKANNVFTTNSLSNDFLYVPTGSRTTAEPYGISDYIYWGAGGVSWATPYVLGLAGIANKIDKSLSQDDMTKLLMSTAYQVNDVMHVINPVGFIAAVLKGADQSDIADKMLSELAVRQSYVYALYNSAKMTAADIKAMASYLSMITDDRVLLLDVKDLPSAEEIYKMLQVDAGQRGGRINGVQIFGTGDMVPAFELKYKVQMPNDIDEGGTFLSDFFYSNLNNNAYTISHDFNIKDTFATNQEIDLVPRWAVARLPLNKNKFTQYFERYMKFMAQTGLEQMDVVNFSSPIFASKTHIDDMGEFLNRLSSEFKLLNIPYKLYGNLDGKYPVTAEVLGNFTVENIKKENTAASCEFIINGHGQWNNTDQCIYESDDKSSEKRVSFLNMNNINSTLGGNTYYLDLWTCLNGYAMKNNLVTTALNGKCVGAFAATTIISNNGVDNKATLEKLRYNNFYYFYYSYFEALNSGNTRSTAFYEAQRAYAQALINNSSSLDGASNYQFNLYNLLAYHNFGVLEPNPAVSQVIKSVAPIDVGTDIKSSEKVVKTVSLSFTAQYSDNSNVAFSGLTAHKLDNGKIRFEISFTAADDYYTVTAFNPPNADKLKVSAETMVSPKDTSFSFELEQSKLKPISMLVCSLHSKDSQEFIIVKEREFKKILALCR